MKKEANKQLRILDKRQQLIMALLFCLGVILQVGNVAVKLGFLEAQKAVQNGDFSGWKAYLTMLLVLEIFSVAKKEYDLFYNDTAKRYVHKTVTERYHNYGRSHEKGILMLQSIAIAEILIPLDLFGVLIGFYDIRKNIQMLSGTFNLQNSIASILLFTISMLCGIGRGKHDSIKEAYGTKLSANKNDTLKFTQFSESYQKNTVKVMDNDYKKMIFQRCIRKFFECFPSLLKQSLYIVLVCGLVNARTSDSLYSDSYLLLTAYGTVLSISELVGKILSKLTEIHQMRKNPDVQALFSHEARRNDCIRVNKSTVFWDNGTLYIDSKFALSMRIADRVYPYNVVKTIVIPQGKHVHLKGIKKTGKTTLLTTLQYLFPDCVMLYTPNCKILSDFPDNFDVQKDFDASLIRELAHGLRLQDLESLSDEKLKSLEIRDANTADRNLLVILVMLYYAIKNPDCAKLIILDELFANIDTVNSKHILEFIMEKVHLLGSTVIFVGHSQQELISAYSASEITLKLENDVVNVTQTQI